MTVLPLDPDTLLPALPPLLAFGYFAWKRLLTYLHIFQQEEYDGPRFARWLGQNAAIDKRATVALAVIGFAAPLVRGAIGELAGWALAAAAAAVLLGVGAIERDPRKAAKKKLALTARARRILIAGGALAAVPPLAVALTGAPVWAWLVPVQLIPAALVLGNSLLMPSERRVQKRYWHEAHDKLTRLAPTVVGITGSYGKTSVKHILGHMLETVAPTLITPGSVNTPMGIARVVRESLGSHHRFFVCEMGAYGPGSIARLCRLAPPDFAVITAIGMAHYERFKSLDTVAEAKFELAEAAISKGGKVVLPADLAEIAPAGERMRRDPERYIRIGEGADCALALTAVEETPDGLAVTVRWEGETYELRAPLFGRHHATNLALAFAAACALGVRPADAQLALKRTPQIAHRLEVKPQPDGSVLLDDAYNANPVGFAAALEAMTLLKKKHGGRAILVTPGMVELGAAHDEEHRRIGQLAAEHADLLLAVVPDRIEALCHGFTEAGGPDPIRCPTFADAQAWLAENRRPGDVVLLENDLPDLYERPLKL